MPYALDDLQYQWLGLLQGKHCKFERSLWGGFYVKHCLDYICGMLETP
jgi:hypothetical protein